MNKISKKDLSKSHAKAITRTYLTLGVAFLCMVAINIYAYFTITNMSEVYASLENAAVNIELTSTNANLLFREIISGYVTDKDMNDVWDMVRKADDYSEAMAELNEKVKIKEKISKFNDVLVKCYEAYRDPEKQGDAKLFAVLRNEYNSAFMNLIGEVDQIKYKLKQLIIQKMLTFKFLYAALIVNFLLLFWFTMYTFRRYVNKRKEVELDLRNARDDMDIIFNSLDSMVIIVNTEGGVTQWNSAAENYFNIPSERAIGKAVWITLPFLMSYKTKIETLPLSQKSAELYKEKIATENERFFNIALSALSFGKGVVIRLDDMTEQVLRDEQLRHAQKMEVVKNLIGGLANGFNNVLGAITGTISMMKYSLENKGGDLNEVKNNMDVIESSTERAVVMVQQLLSLSSEHEVKLVPIDLNEVVIHVLKICQNTFDKRIELVAELCDLKVMVKADPAQIEQCLLNICDNAAQAMTSMRGEDEVHGGELNVSLDLMFPDKEFRAEHPDAKQNSYWHLSISDTGVGMNQEMLRKVFDPFYSTKDRSESTGLGLTLVQDIIKQHNGFISVSSNPKEGTVFNIYLPELAATAPAAEGREEKARETVSASDQIPTGSGLIFVVDDEEVMRKTANNILEKLGYDIMFAEDGQEAVEIYKDNYKDIKVVLLDMAMPRMSGKDAYVEMKKINPNVKALLVSGFKKDDRIVEALELGVNGFIQKPYSMITLAQEVKKLVVSG